MSLMDLFHKHFWSQHVKLGGIDLHFNHRLKHTELCWLCMRLAKACPNVLHAGRSDVSPVRIWPTESSHRWMWISSSLYTTINQHMSLKRIKQWAGKSVTTTERVEWSADSVVQVHTLRALAQSSVHTDENEPVQVHLFLIEPPPIHSKCPIIATVHYRITEITYKSQRKMMWVYVFHLNNLSIESCYAQSEKKRCSEDLLQTQWTLSGRFQGNVYCCRSVINY